MSPGMEPEHPARPEPLPRKRFVAGAVCPRCGVQDRIRSWETDGRQCRDCVECGFEDSLAAVSLDAVVPGRLDQPRPQPASEARPLLFHPRPRRSAPAADTADDDASDAAPEDGAAGGSKDGSAGASGNDDGR